MTGDARQTEVNDPETAQSNLAAMVTLAETMGQKVTAIVSRISAAESSKPWGTAHEYGGKFEESYTQGKGGAGAEFVKDQVGILTTETTHGVDVAHKALQGTVDLDHELSGMFKVADSDSVGTQMSTTLKAQTSDG
jgi:hypothetical protein